MICCSVTQILSQAESPVAVRFLFSPYTGSRTPNPRSLHRRRQASSGRLVFPQTNDNGSPYTQVAISNKYAFCTDNGVFGGNDQSLHPSKSSPLSLRFRSVAPLPSRRRPGAPESEGPLLRPRQLEPLYDSRPTGSRRIYAFVPLGWFCLPAGCGPHINGSRYFRSDCKKDSVSNVQAEAEFAIA